MKKATRIVIVVVVIAVVLLALMTQSRRSRNAAALTAYKAELRAKGEKLTFQELGFPRPPESSSNLDLLVAGVKQLPANAIEPGSPECMRFVGMGRAEVIWALPELRLPYPMASYSNTAPWKSFSAQFEAVSNALHQIRVATQFPPRYVSHDPANFTNWPSAQWPAIRAATFWLKGDCVVALHAGQLERAAADVHALSQLAQFYREDLWLVSHMVRSSIVNVGLGLTWEALQAPGWSEKGLSAMQRDWEAFDLAEMFERGVVGERAWGESVADQMRAMNPRQRLKLLRSLRIEGGKPPAWYTAKEYFAEFVGMPLWRANAEADELLALKIQQQSLESFRQLQAGTLVVEIQRQLDAHVGALDAVGTGWLAQYHYLLCGYTLSHYPSTAIRFLHIETQRRLTVTALALERFRLRHGKLPPELAALVPQFLSAVPLDLMSAKPLRYQLNADGSFMLYSVGEDGRDDGGEPNSASGTNKFGLWEGKDAVWPTAVK